MLWELEPSDPGYHLQHPAVIREEAATTKVHVVFNASAAAKNGKFLDDVVDPGLSLLLDITGMLLQFQEIPAAIQVDIKKAFLMIEVKKSDRPYLQFLLPDEAGNMTIWRLKRLPLGVNYLPFLLNAVIQHHLKTTGNKLRRTSKPFSTYCEKASTSMTLYPR